MIPKTNPTKIVIIFPRLESVSNFFLSRIKFFIFDRKVSEREVELVDRVTSVLAHLLATKMGIIK